MYLKWFGNDFIHESKLTSHLIKNIQCLSSVNMIINQN